MMDKGQQNIKEGSAGYQAGRDIIVKKGISYIEAKEIFSDLFRSNFITLKNVAKEIAEKRAESFLENFLNVLQKKNPEGIVFANDPSFQMALVTAQKTYACSEKDGNDVEDLLIETLVEKTKSCNEPFFQIVLNEALNIIPKLTNKQLNILSLVFLLRHAVSPSVIDTETLNNYFKKWIYPLFEGISQDESSVVHLLYTGCAVRSSQEFVFRELMRYKFYKLERLKRASEREKHRNKTLFKSKIFIYPNQEKGKDADVNYAIIKPSFDILDMFGLSIVSRIKVDRGGNKMKNIYENLWKEQIEKWDNTDIRFLELSSVGIMIAYFNLVVKIDTFSNIHNWIS